MVAACASIVALVLAGCGGKTEPPPSGDKLIKDMMGAVQQHDSAKFKLDASLTADSDNRIYEEFLRKGPIELTAEGAVSGKAAKIDAKLSALGRTFATSGVADRDRAFIKWAGQWFGPIDDGMDRMADQAQESAGLPAWSARDVTGLFMWTAEEGREFDHVETWKLTGRLDTDAAVKLVEKHGTDVTAKDRKEIDRLADSLAVGMLVGREDHLPRRVKLRIDWTNKPEKGVLYRWRAFDVAATLDLHDWGDAEVSFTTPANPSPGDQLQNKFTESLMDAIYP